MKVTDRIAPILLEPARMRNIAIVAHIDHGKTTFSDALLASSGLLSKELAGHALMLDSHDDERARGITIDSALATLLYAPRAQRPEDAFAINLIDTPGHIDFGGDVGRALRAADGCIVLVCAVEGVMPQTETVLREAMREKVKPLLFINKIDRLVRELQLSPEQVQERLGKIIVEVNALIRHYGDTTEWDVAVADSSVCFGSAAHGWALSAKRMREGKVSFRDVMRAYSEDQDAARSLARRFPLADALLESVVAHLPSPVAAQRYRIPALWHGDLASPRGKALLSCDPDADFLLVVTKIESLAHGQELVVARLFCGTVRPSNSGIVLRTGQPIVISQVFVGYGPKRDPILAAAAGAVVMLGGFKGVVAGDAIAAKANGDHGDQDHSDKGGFERLTELFEPVVTKSIEPVRPQEMARLKEALEQVMLEDPSLRLEENPETGELLLSGMGELHLEVIENRLRDVFGVQVQSGSPIVLYRETVTRSTDLPKRLKAVFPSGQGGDFLASVSPVAEEGAGVREDRNHADASVQFAFRADPFRADPLAGAGRAQGDSHDNALVFASQLATTGSHANGVHGNGGHAKSEKAASSLRDLVEQAFAEVMRAGPLAGEPCMHVKLTLMDVTGDLSGLREARDIQKLASGARNAMREAMRHAAPALLEPIETLRFDVPPEYIGEITKLIAAKRGEILEIKDSTMRVGMLAKLAVREMIALASDVRSATEGKASFSVIGQDFARVDPAHQDETLRMVRRRKGLLFSST